jgi:tRNA(Ile)-lysidine synthase
MVTLVGRRNEVSAFRLIVSVATKAAAAKNEMRRSLSVSLDADKVEGARLIRSAKSGDSFVPLGMSGTKKVSDYFIDKKVDRPLRDEIPVVCDSRGIVWLVGFEIAGRVKRDSTTRKVVEIAVRHRKQSSPASV